jgi:plasmid stability protein
LLVKPMNTAQTLDSIVIGCLRLWMADLLVRGVDEALVRALKKRAGAHGRSQEAEHRAILAAALLSPARRNLAELLAAMPDVGSDEDFRRSPDPAEAADVLG